MHTQTHRVHTNKNVITVVVISGSHFRTSTITDIICLSFLPCSCLSSLLSDRALTWNYLLYIRNLKLDISRKFLLTNSYWRELVISQFSFLELFQHCIKVSALAWGGFSRMDSDRNVLWKWTNWLFRLPRELQCANFFWGTSIFSARMSKRRRRKAESLL